MKKKTLLRATLISTIFVAICCAVIFFVATQPDTSGTTVASNVVTPDVILPTATPVPTEAPTPTPSPTPTPTPTPEPFQEYDIHLLALGDNLMHMGVINAGLQADGSYNYDFLFDDISDYLTEAEIKITNQETIFGGNDLGFSGYPMFNSPTQVGDAIANAGFNVVLHSTNHTYDKGLAGIKHCISFWDTNYPEMVVCGMSNPEEEREIPLLTVGDFTFAILNYTYGPNSSVLRHELMGWFDMLCNYDKETGAIDFTTLNPQVIEDIQKAKTLADVVIVAPHWGTEYTTTPTKYQETFAKQIAEAGADLIIGTHPHVPQPIEWIETESGHKTLCYYSLGNYVSTQQRVLTMLEGMAWVTFHVTEDGISISDEDSGVLPLVCHYNSNPVRTEGVYPLETYTEEKALSHGIWQYGGVELHLADLQAYSNQIFGDRVLSISDILTGESTAETEAPADATHSPQP